VNCSDSAFFRELELGAEYLAGKASTRAERLEHLKMVGTFHGRYRRAGGVAADDVHH
jgi:hypothetical protein